MLKQLNIRREITDLTDPLQMRELNRQLAWIYRQLHGGLSIDCFSEAGKRQIASYITSATQQDDNGEEEV